MDLIIDANLLLLTNDDLLTIDGGWFIEIAIGILGCIAYYGISSLVKAKTGKHIHEWAGEAIIWVTDNVIYIFG